VIRQQTEIDPVATVGGMLTGGLIGLIGGPIAAAVGMSAGTLMGAAVDMAREGVDEDFIDDMGAHLIAPGKSAVIAEIEENWQVPLDTRMEALGGTVLRRTRTDIEDLYFEREIEAAQRDIEALEAERIAAFETQEKDVQEKIAKLQLKIEAANQKVAEKEAALEAKLRSIKEEASDKVAILEAQRKNASAEAKAALDRRIVEVRSEYQRRADHLKQALGPRKAAPATV
jgi:uncharacterized membrane protein